MLEAFINTLIIFFLQKSKMFITHCVYKVDYYLGYVGYCRFLCMAHSLVRFACLAHFNEYEGILYNGDMSISMLEIYYNRSKHSFIDALLKRNLRSPLILAKVFIRQ